MLVYYNRYATGSVTVAKWVANFKDGEGEDFADNEFDPV